ANVGGDVHPRDSSCEGALERACGLAALGRGRFDPDRRDIHFAVSWLALRSFGAAAAALVCCGAVYNLLAIAGALRFRRKNSIPDFAPPVSILKPVRGRDDR